MTIQSFESIRRHDMTDKHQAIAMPAITAQTKQPSCKRMHAKIHHHQTYCATSYLSWCHSISAITIHLLRDAQAWLSLSIMRERWLHIYHGGGGNCGLCHMDDDTVGSSKATSLVVIQFLSQYLKISADETILCHEGVCKLCQDTSYKILPATSSYKKILHWSYKSFTVIWQ